MNVKKLDLIELDEVELSEISGGKSVWRSLGEYVGYAAGVTVRKLDEYANSFSDAMQYYAPVRY